MYVPNSKFLGPRNHASSVIHRNVTLVLCTKPLRVRPCPSTARVIARRHICNPYEQRVGVCETFPVESVARLEPHIYPVYPLHPPFFLLLLASCPPTNQILLESKLALVFASPVPFFSDSRIPNIRTLYSSLQSRIFGVCACSVIGVNSSWDSNSDKSRGELCV